MKYLLALASAITLFAQHAGAQSPAIGVVVMHGKGGSPTRWVAALASGLEQKGYLVASLEMPWSGRRHYDVDVATADKEVDAALDGLRAKGAKKLFVAGHSQGGVFVLHYGSTHPVDGIIAIAPGGNVANQAYAREVGASVERARKLVGEGKGEAKEAFDDFEGSKGRFTVTASAAAYLSWFDPQGAMNQVKSSKAIPSRVPVLFVAPTRDYPALQRVRAMMFGALPKNPLTRMYEPSASHLEAPGASIEEVARWTSEVAGTGQASAAQ
jgi:pimeloyl-ACP methyl ester carboxylesterase